MSRGLKTHKSYFLTFPIRFQFVTGLTSDFRETYASAVTLASGHPSLSWAVDNLGSQRALKTEYEPHTTGASSEDVSLH